WQIRV
ncbi:tRNA threonylcarbamoyladenosine biosynthesis protein TsaB, partial [Haemophilus influenzae]